jgi:hypothetical protein
VIHTMNLPTPPTSSSARATCHVADTIHTTFGSKSPWCVGSLPVVSVANDINILVEDIWGRKRQCIYGENCRYQHYGTNLLDDITPLNIGVRNARTWQTVPCKHFMRTGHCPVGDSCNLYVIISRLYSLLSDSPYVAFMTSV